MHNVNWWLMALAFVLGLVLTLSLLIRRVKREVPSTRRSARVRACGRGCGGCGRRRETQGGGGKLKGSAVSSRTNRTVRARCG